MKVISIKQPWAYLICTGIKDIENRTWKLPEKIKGQRVLIHASGKSDKEPYMIFNEEQNNAIGDRIMDVCGSYDNTSAIIGSVVFTDCMINHSSIWAEKSLANYNTFCKSKHCKEYIEWECYGYHTSCKLQGESHNIGDIASDCPFKREAPKPIYNWVASAPVLFDAPIPNIRGKLNFWDYYGVESQDIICPNCGSIEHAIVDLTTCPWNTFIHECKQCGYVVQESEWECVNSNK